MAQDIVLARTAFASTLSRSEPGFPDITQEDATLFARTILKTCNVCTTSNIKLCTSFIKQNILFCPARATALIKYLVSLSRSFVPRETEVRVDTTKPGDENEGLGKIVNGKVQQPPESAFKRLHILYIFHDVILHVQRHSLMHVSQNLWRHDPLPAWQPSICALAQLAVCGCGGNVASTRPLVTDLLSFWDNAQLFTSAQIEDMRDKVTQADGTEWDTMLRKLAAEEQSKGIEHDRAANDESNWIVPEHHGVANDPSAPWHELPAANGLYLRRVHGYPLRASALPVGGYQLRNGGYEADPQLKKDVNDLYTEVIRCYDKYISAEDVQDIDALGNIIWKDPDRPTRNYWGFTLDGIDRRKELGQQFAENATGYDEFGGSYGSGARVNDAVERARALAAERGRGMGVGRGRGGGGGGRPGWRGGRRW